MTKNDVDFETWFDNLSIMVLDRTGVDLKDHDSVRSDYEAGKNVFDVADEVSSEYGEE